jgi:hypothetical protein
MYKDTFAQERKQGTSYTRFCRRGWRGHIYTVIHPKKAYDVTIEFEYKGELDTCYDNIFLGFFKYLYGTAPTDDNYDSITEGGFKMYDQHNLVGRQKVYLKTFDPNELIHQSGDHLTFKLTFRVTDPTTDIALTDPNAKVTL